MKRIVLIIGAILLCLALRAQSVSYTCRYWFDQNEVQTTTFSDGTWQAELDVGSLADGLHTLHLHVMDTSMKWSAPQSYLFLKTTVTVPENFVYQYWFDEGQRQSSPIGNGIFLLDVATLDAGIHTLHVMLKGSDYSSPQSYIFLKPELTGFDADNWVYHCWIDEDFAHRQTDSLGSGNFLLDVADLEEGLHTLNVFLQGNSLTATQSYMFMRVEMLETNSIDMSNLTYHCWFDQDYEHQQTDSLRDGNILLDVNGLEDGLHTMNMMLEGGTGTMTATQTYMFLKVAVDDPSLETQYRCWFDEDDENMQTGLLGSGIFQLEVSGLSNGLHTVHVHLDKGKYTSPQTYFFYKILYGGNGLNKWEYCINGLWSDKVTTNIVPAVDTLSIVSLLPVPTQPIRSTCFQFHPNGDTPEIFAKNEITLRFWTADDHFVDRSAFYVDEYVSETIEADTLERNTTVCIAAPRDNYIKWYKLPLQYGDSVAFRTDKACTMQLFSPSGEEVYAATAGEALVLGGCHAFEDGDYYLAVHDVMGSGEEVCLTNVFVHKYAILAYDVHLVGNGGCSTITFQGNGFNSLLDVYLVNWQNDTIRRLDIGHESNTTSTVTFNFYEANLGVYDAVFQFYDETIRINGALEVQEPVDIVLTSSVSYPSQYLRNTACTYTYTITNNGNMSAYGVPLFVYIASATIEGISHIGFDGLNLPSLFDEMILDSLTPNQIVDIKEWINKFGNEDFFSFSQIINDETGDTIIARCNYFFVNLAPFETKTLNLKITANELLDVWMTVPSETIQPLTLDSNRGLRYQFCCVSEKVECYVRMVSDRLNVVSLVTDALALAGTALNLAGPIGTTVSAVLLAIAGFTTIASCLATTGNEIIQRFNDVVCADIDESVWHNFWHVALPKSGWSLWHVLMSCIPMSELFKIASPKEVEISLEYLKEALLKQIAGLATDGGAMISPVEMDCLTEYYEKWPNCPRGDSGGGPSTPVNSLDPNDIHGYLSESGSHYMRQEIQNIHYEIEFENDTTLATAAAHTIIVRDTLDATRFDLSSLATHSVTIGDKRLELNGEQTFAKTLDMRPELYVIAQVEQDYDPATGIIEWTIQSLDPMTMEPTDNPYQGVLPVNYYGDGIGFIDYSVNLLQAFDDGTEISNRAGIIFDQNEVILTPTWTNIVDAVKPTSHIEEVVVENDSLNFSFVSSDIRSGVWYHSLYHRNDSTGMEWQVRKAQIFGNSFMLPLDSLQTTEYLVKAVDSAGNVEDKEMVAEYTYYSNAPATVTQANALTQGWNWWSTYVEMNGVDGLALLENSLGHNGLTIKSQNDFIDNYYQDVGYDYWYGSLESIQNERGYLINVSAACNASLSGRVANPALHPITIQPNWNWIGYPVAMPQAVTSALAGFNAQADDVVKGQSDFTSYYEGYGWYPEDFMLIPGQSYLYFSNANANKTLTYANGGRGGVLRPQKSEKPYWKNDVHAFADNLNVMAIVSVDSEEQRDENLELGAFVNGECRGSVRLRHFAPLDRYYALLTVSGQDGDLVEFRIVHTESLEMNEACSNRLVFSKNAIVGSLNKPYEIRFGDVDEVTGSMALYPNPVERGEAFSLYVPSGETITEIVITDVLGNQLRHETGAVNINSIKGLPTAGVYVIKAVSRSGITYHGRLIVE